MEFEWDVKKELININKHKLDFTLASQIFYDDNILIRYDDAHSYVEDRYIAIGRIGMTNTVILVAYTVRAANVIRVISARKATGKEREVYFNGYCT